MLGLLGSYGSGVDDLVLPTGVDGAPRAVGRIAFGPTGILQRRFRRDRVVAMAGRGQASILFDGMHRPRHTDAGRMHECDARSTAAHGTALEHFKVKAGKNNRRAFALPWVMNHLE